MPSFSNVTKIFSIFGLGMVVAAAGVGAGDLAVSAIKGREIGVAIVWAVFLGALFKFLISEGIARYQLATGQTILEGMVLRLSPFFRIVLMIYLPIWSLLTAIMLMSAVGVASQSILPIPNCTDVQAKTIYGLIHSLIAVSLIWVGGYKGFERAMAICVALMTAGVIFSAIRLSPSLTEVARSAIIPTAARPRSVIELIGGVGGTVTMLSYCYWLREAGRSGREDLNLCRLDLATGYLMTALFAGSMVVIGSQIQFDEDGSNTRILLNIAQRLAIKVGEAGKWVFLLGAWAAVASSLLGVWQGTPYLFADLWSMRSRVDGEHPPEPVRSDGKFYRGYLLAMATIPAAGVYLIPFATVAKLYAFTGALVVPSLSIILLRLNGSEKFVGEFRNRFWTSLILYGVVAFFIVAGGIELYDSIVAFMKPS